MNTKEGKEAGRLIIESAYRQFDKGNVDALSDFAENELREALPHGSGIDADWSFAVLKNGSIVCRCSYHGMDENGFYDGWQDFHVKLFRHTKDKLNPLKGPSEGKVQILHRKGDVDFSLHLSGYRHRKSWAYQLKDYLEETVHYALSEAGFLMNRYEIVKASQV